MFDTHIPRVQEALTHASRILVVSHVRPDGDAVGSVLGLGLSLQEAGKSVQMVLNDGVPSNFGFLPGAEQVVRKPQGEIDLIIVVDCSDIQRVGAALDGYGQPDINIDHHVTNLNFARINLVDAKAVSTTQILTEMIRKMQLPLTQPAGMALLTGLITDTLGFRTRNMTPKAIRLVADLMEAGIDMPYLYEKSLMSKSYEAIRYWGCGLSQLQRDGRIVWTSLKLDDRREIGYPGRDDADLINVLSKIKDCDIAVIFVEQPDHKIKVSWRARPGFDTSKVALSFGGGGHTAASGAEIEGSLEEVQENVLRATRALFNSK